MKKAIIFLTLVLFIPLFAQRKINNNTVTIATDGVITIGNADKDPIVISPTAKGTTSYTGTITTTGDLTSARTYQLTDYNGIMWVTGSRFNRPHLLTSTSWAAVGKNDGNTNYVIGSSLGPMTYREEQNKTTRSWVETVTGLNLDADATVNNEGVLFEWYCYHFNQ